MQRSFPSLLPSPPPACLWAYFPLCSHLNRKVGGSFTLIIRVGYALARAHISNRSVTLFPFIPQFWQRTTNTTNNMQEICKYASGPAWSCPFMISDYSIRESVLYFSPTKHCMTSCQIAQSSIKSLYACIFNSIFRFVSWRAKTGFIKISCNIQSNSYISSATVKPI